MCMFVCVWEHEQLFMCVHLCKKTQVCPICRHSNRRHGEKLFLRPPAGCHDVPQAEWRLGRAQSPHTSSPLLHVWVLGLPKPPKIPVQLDRTSVEHHPRYWPHFHIGRQRQNSGGQAALQAFENSEAHGSLGYCGGGAGASSGSCGQRRSSGRQVHHAGGLLGRGAA